MSIGEGKTLYAYSYWYWELYNKIGKNYGELATSSFKLGLPLDSKLSGSLTKQPPKNMHQLMRRIEEYKRLEDDT